MSLSSLWAKIPQPVKTTIFSVLTGGAVFGTSQYVSNKPEVTVAISAGRQQLIDTGHVDRKVLKQAVNKAIEDVFNAQGFCKDPVVAEKDISETVSMARQCSDAAPAPKP
jgi:hypothetical protein